MCILICIIYIIIIYITYNWPCPAHTTPQRLTHNENWSNMHKSFITRKSSGLSDRLSGSAANGSGSVRQEIRTGLANAGGQLKCWYYRTHHQLISTISFYRYIDCDWFKMAEESIAARGQITPESRTVAFPKARPFARPPTSRHTLYPLAMLRRCNIALGVAERRWGGWADGPGSRLLLGLPSKKCCCWFPSWAWEVQVCIGFYNLRFLFAIRFMYIWH